MASTIDATKPIDGIAAVKADFRANFAAAKSEIESLQAESRERFYSVKTDFGAVANGVADDTTAIQDAVDSGEALYFPPGTYLITAPIQYDGGLVMRGALSRPSGNPTSVITGSFGSSLFHRTNWVLNGDDTYSGSVPSGTSAHGLVVVDMGFVNSHTSAGCCFQVSQIEPAQFIRCDFDHRFRGLLFLGSNQFSFVEACKFKNSWSGRTVETWPEYINAYGLMASGHATVLGCNFIGCGTGGFFYGSQNSLLGARLEVNGIGLRLGGPSLTFGGQFGANVAASAGTFQSMTFESNYQNLWLYNTSARIQDISILGGTNAPPNESGTTGEYGIRIDAATMATIDGVGASGTFRRAAIWSANRARMRNVSGNTNSIGPVFSSAGVLISAISGLTDYQLIRTQFNPSVNDPLTADRETITAFHDLQLRGIKGLDILNANILPNNLGMIASVTAAATTLAVSFLASQGSGNAGLTSLTPVTDGVSTLAAGTYEYASTLIAPRGQTGIGALATGAYKSVVVASGERVDVALAATSGYNRMRRLYRVNAGAPSGRWAGYWQLPISQNSFSDTGNTAFDGLDGPPGSTYAIPAETEVDANYAVVATPSWGTTCWITNKATSGFTINFGTAAPAAATVQWLLFRP